MASSNGHQFFIFYLLYLYNYSMRRSHYYNLTTSNCSWPDRTATNYLFIYLLYLHLYNYCKFVYIYKYISIVCYIYENYIWTQFVTGFSTIYFFHQRNSLETKGYFSIRTTKDKTNNNFWGFPKLQRALHWWPLREKLSLYSLRACTIVVAY